MEWLRGKTFDCLGVASFGPIELHHGEPKYGFITTTPKAGWRDIDVVGNVRRGLGLPEDFPVGWDTDVNAPALAEYSEVSEVLREVEASKKLRGTEKILNAVCGFIFIFLFLCSTLSYPSKMCFYLHVS